MRTVQMTLDDDLVELTDRVVEKLHTTRSAFTRAALREARLEHSLRQSRRKSSRRYERQYSLL